MSLVRKRFRDILAGNGCVSPASVFDPLSARAAEQIGYEAGMMAGSICSLSVLGAPDLVLLTLTEFATQARRICRASALPLMVDADHGYGNALNARRTVEELEAAGVVALTIEDTLLPAPFGGTDKGLISLAEGVGKIRAALSGRTDPALVIAARTSAIPIAGLAEAIERSKAYQDAGADALFIAGLQTRTQLEALTAAVSIPIMLGTAAPALRDFDYLAAKGVRVFFEGHQPFYASLFATFQALDALRQGAERSSIPIASADLVKRLTHAADYERLTRDFLSGPSSQPQAK